MTREEIQEMNLDALEDRAAAIAKETTDADAEKLAALNAELDAIEERRAAIERENEERRKAINAVVNGAGKTIDKVEERKSTTMEIRNSKEYLDAWVEMQKGKATVEQRALLTQNAENGTIAVPSIVEDRINTAWEQNEIIRRVRRTFFKGNLRVPVEVSADGAVAHAEGGAAIADENLVIKFVELIPGTIKKKVSYSTEVMDLKGEAWVNYIFDEIEYQIVRKAEELIVGAMSANADPALVVMHTAAGATLTTEDVIAAEGLLSGAARNLALITTRSTAAALKAAAISGNYGYDPFDGLEVLYVDATSLGSYLGVVADLSGVQINFPNGDQPNFVFDEFTDAASDIIHVIGRMMAAVGVVSVGKIVRIESGE